MYVDTQKLQSQMKSIPKSHIGLNPVEHINCCFVDFQENAIEYLNWRNDYLEKLKKRLQWARNILFQWNTLATNELVP